MFYLYEQAIINDALEDITAAKHLAIFLELDDGAVTNDELLDLQHLDFSYYLSAYNGARVNLFGLLCLSNRVEKLSQLCERLGSDYMRAELDSQPFLFDYLSKATIEYLSTKAPEHFIKALQRAAKSPNNHNSPPWPLLSYASLQTLRQCKKQFSKAQWQRLLLSNQARAYHHAASQGDVLRLTFFIALFPAWLDSYASNTNPMLVLYKAAFAGKLAVFQLLAAKLSTHHRPLQAEDYAQSMMHATMGSALDTVSYCFNQAPEYCQQSVYFHRALRAATKRSAEGIVDFLLKKVTSPDDVAAIIQQDDYQLFDMAIRGLHDGQPGNQRAMINYFLATRPTSELSILIERLARADLNLAFQCLMDSAHTDNIPLDFELPACLADFVKMSFQQARIAATNAASATSEATARYLPADLREMSASYLFFSQTGRRQAKRTLDNEPRPTDVDTPSAKRPRTT